MNKEGLRYSLMLHVQLSAHHYLQTIRETKGQEIDPYFFKMQHTVTYK